MVRDNALRITPPRPGVARRPERSVLPTTSRDAESALRPLVESRDLQAKPAIHLANRDEFQQWTDAWDKALASIPTAVTADFEPVVKYYAAGRERRAPTAGTAPVEPIYTSNTDGYLPLNAEDLQGYLQDLARAGFMSDVTITLDFPRRDELHGTRTYVFATPVTSVNGAVGDLFTLAASGELIPYQTGTPTLRLVEKIDPRLLAGLAEAIRDERQLTCTYFAGTARWHENDTRRTTV